MPSHRRRSSALPNIISLLGFGLCRLKSRACGWWLMSTLPLYIPAPQLQKKAWSADIVSCRWNLHHALFSEDPPRYTRKGGMGEKNLATRSIPCDWSFLVLPCQTSFAKAGTGLMFQWDWPPEGPLCPCDLPSKPLNNPQHVPQTSKFWYRRPDTMDYIKKTWRNQRYC